MSEQQMECLEFQKEIKTIEQLEFRKEIKTPYRNYTK